MTMEKDIREDVLFLWGFGIKTPQKKQRRKLCCFFVGVARLERATACTPCKNASQLHHTPIAFAAAKIGSFFEWMFTLTKKKLPLHKITLNSNP